MSSVDRPRILVEGGPVHRRVNHILAALIGFGIGVGSVMGFLIVEAVDTSTSNHNLALKNCHNLATLAKIERGFIARQEEQSRGLLEHGITFGIPKALLPKLIAESARSQATFLHELDKLTILNCAPGSLELPKGVRLAKGESLPPPLGLAGAGALLRPPS